MQSVPAKMFQSFGPWRVMPLSSTWSTDRSRSLTSPPGRRRSSQSRPRRSPSSSMRSSSPSSRLVIEGVSYKVHSRDVVTCHVISTIQKKIELVSTCLLMKQQFHQFILNKDNTQSSGSLLGLGLYQVPLGQSATCRLLFKIQR